MNCKRASLLVLRKEQGDDPAEDQSGDALATGDLHQVQDCESTVTEDGLLSQECNQRLARTL